VYADFVARRIDSSIEYRGKLRMAPSGSVYLHATRLSGGVESLLAAEVPVAGLTHQAGAWIRVRGQVVGTSPTTIRLKAWADGQAEPGAWLYTATDSTAALQAAGGIGLRGYLAAANTNAPVVNTYDDLLVASIE
jgi:hypothetical protein